MLWTCCKMSARFVWTHLSLASRGSPAGFSHGASTCLKPCSKRSTSSSSLRTFQKNQITFTQKNWTLMWTAWFTWKEAMKLNRRGQPAGSHGRTASWGWWRRRRVSEETSWFDHTDTDFLDLSSSSEKRMRPTCTGQHWSQVSTAAGLLLYPLGYRPARWIYE